MILLTVKITVFWTNRSKKQEKQNQLKLINIKTKESCLSKKRNINIFFYPSNTTLFVSICLINSLIKTSPKFK